MSNLVEHARRELKTIGEDKATSDGLLKVVQAFVDMGHSGGSAAVAITMLTELLQFQNISPLTDDETEWHFHANADYGLSEDAWGNGQNGVWQNRRNGEAFSHDGGKTYYLLSEGANDGNRQPLHDSRLHKPCPYCGTTARSSHKTSCPNHESRIQVDGS